MKKKDERFTGKYSFTVTISFFLLILSLSLASVLLPDREVSKEERRHYADFPKLSWKTISNGSFMDDLEEYLLDQFVARDGFRSLKTEIETTLFGKKDANQYVLWQDGLFELDTEWKPVNVTRTAKELAALQEQWFAEAEVYYGIIPDKSYFLPKEEFPIPKEEQVISEMQKYLTEAVYIDLYPYLTIDDYYRTDLHWRQEAILDIADVLLETMQTGQKEGKKMSPNPAYAVTEVSDTFYGGYAGASAYKTEPDRLCGITGKDIDVAVVYDYEKKQEVSVYAPEKLDGTDPYDYYLWGARALLTIRNSNIQNGEKLLLFRDSFGSSIAPLLIKGYEEITLVDLRYISADYLPELIELQEYDDVLFLYSGRILRHSDSLKF